jgi:hypothetical protein
MMKKERGSTFFKKIDLFVRNSFVKKEEEESLGKQKRFDCPRGLLNGKPPRAPGWIFFSAWRERAGNRAGDRSGSKKATETRRDTTAGGRAAQPTD